MADKTVNFAADRKYTTSHEWVKMEGDLAVIGISDYAQDQLGDVVFVELPAIGASVEAGQPFGSVDSVKAASDLFSPLSGTVQAINEKLSASPEVLNKDAFGDGWIIKIRPSNPAEMDKLIDAATYQSKIESGAIH